MIRLNVSYEEAMEPVPRDIAERVVGELEKVDASEGVEVRLDSYLLASWFETETYSNPKTGKEVHGRPYELFEHILKERGYETEGMEFGGEGDILSFRAKRIGQHE